METQPQPERHTEPKLDGEATPERHAAPPLIGLAIGLPHYQLKTVSWQMDMWLSMGFALASASNRFELRQRNIVDVCGVEVARNKLMQDALALRDAARYGAVPTIDWLLMVDADTWHDDAFDILQAISDADKNGAAIVAFPTPRRAVDSGTRELMVYKHAPGEPREPLRLIDINAAKHRGEKHLLIQSAATSMMAINLNFVRNAELKPPWFRFEWSYGSTNFVSEDLHFCERVAAAGGKIYASTSFIAKHLCRPEVLTG